MPIIINDNTTWKAGQTITLTEDVQVAPGVTLTIEPGAIVEGKGHAIVVYGVVNAMGRADSHIAFKELRLFFGGAITSPGSLTLNYVDFSGGTLFPATGNEVYGIFSITNSNFSNAGASYIWYPTGDSTLSGNVFYNSGGLSIGTNSMATVHVTGNAFVNTTSNINGSASIVVWAAYGNPVNVSGNSFFGSSPALEVTIDGKIAGTANYFGTTDPETLTKLILDKNDDLARPSFIATGVNAAEPVAGLMDTIASAGTAVTQSLRALGYILGSSKADTLSGTDSADIILGGDGNDIIEGGLGADILAGGAGNDVFIFNAVRVSEPAPVIIGQINGGVGFDMLNLRGVFPATLGTIQTGPSNFSLGVNVGNQRFVLAEVEEIWLGDSGNRISISSYGEGLTVRSGNGNDDIQVGSDKGGLTTSIFAEGGNDTVFISGVFGGSYIYAIDGGTGTNLLKTNIAFTVDLTAGNAHSGGAQFNITNFQNVMVSANSGYLSTAIGNGAANVLSVNPLFNDGSVGVHFDGRGGNDDITGSRGNDRLTGGEGDDQIDGGAGLDQVILRGKQSEYIFFKNTDGTFTVSDLVPSREGIDTVVNVESVLFSETMLSISLDAPSLVFDSLRYIASHSDLIAAFKLDAAAGASHYVNWGRTEGRGITFDVNIYLAKYSDLRAAFGNDTVAATKHYIAYGFAEGRSVDLSGNDILVGGAGNDTLYGGRGINQIDGGAGTDTLLLSSTARPFLIDGQAVIFDIGAQDRATNIEQVSISGQLQSWSSYVSTAIDPFAYIASHRDLIAAFKLDAAAGASHYVNWGRTEGRGITFDVNIYLAKYSDLRAAFGNDTVAATKHYIAYGFAEGRSVDLSGNDILVGGAGNDTLYGGRGINQIDGGAGTDTLLLSSTARPFLIDGQAVIFDIGAQDRATNIEQVSISGQLQSWSSYVSTAIDPFAYIASHRDLIAAFKLDAAAGASHYVNWGRTEGRGITFDVNIYLAKYSDLRAAFGNDTVAATKHYIAYGFAEGRSVDLPSSSGALASSVSNEILSGGGGNDTLMEGLSIDTSSSGAVSDSFVFSSSPNVVSNLDVLTDFLPSSNLPEFDGRIFSDLSWNDLGSLSPAILVPDTGLTTAEDAGNGLIYDTAIRAFYYHPHGLNEADALQIALLGTTTYTTMNTHDVGGVVI